MDTPFIHEDHQLRAESIAKINDVFAQSKVTLVCDRDLMEIDVQNLHWSCKNRYWQLYLFAIGTSEPGPFWKLFEGDMQFIFFARTMLSSPSRRPLRSSIVKEA